MTQGNGHRFVYKVTVSRHTREVLQQQHRDAVDAGTGAQFVSALRQILERLRQDPTNFGEPLYRLPALKLVVYQGAVSPLLADFAVHEEKPLVFVRGFKII